MEKIFDSNTYGKHAHKVRAINRKIDELQRERQKVIDEACQELQCTNPEFENAWYSFSHS
jgi:hypothetical protein